MASSSGLENHLKCWKKVCVLCYKKDSKSISAGIYSTLTKKKKRGPCSKMEETHTQASKSIVICSKCFF